MSSEASAQAAWADARHGWQQLYGGFDELGVSLESHDFKTSRPLDWGESFRARSVEFCLNLEGRGSIGNGRGIALSYLPSSSGYYAVGSEPLRATRQAHERHRFVTLKFSRAHLQSQLAATEGDLTPAMREAVFPTREQNVVSHPHPMSAEQRAIVASLAAPPVPKAARILWYQSKATELMSHFLFEAKDPEMFCARQKRVARDRVVRAQELILRNLADPPSLETLGQEVGCSPFYLSRVFSREVGLTIPQFLRNARMERAAELLRTGRYNVTEAATEVGYSSLSHFSKSFCETIGCCPVLYPAARHIVLDR
ncbi:MAG: helix-turn-helix transcriptional regulator [Chthoniobacterales bacterium]|nr:helix-turn-helix transcriptional regulator [Chthoniobacterales bacterium]